MPEFTISYVVTTYNKLPYLRQVLSRLVAARQADEEIVVADGGSTDGTPAYLRGLFEAGQIQQFVSERDKGESHGFNKCMLVARGEFVKFITDDDAFCYPAIREAAEFMRQHPGVDVLTGYNAAMELTNPDFARVKETPAKDFQRWYDTKEPFQMIGLPLVIRRSSLPLTGLLSTGVVMADLEFTYRISSLKVNIAWCTAVLSAHVNHADGNFNRLSQKSRDDEYNRIVAYYTNPTRRTFGAVMNEALEASKRPLRPAKRALFDRMRLKQYQDPERFATGFVPVPGEDYLEAIYRICDKFMAAHNASRPIRFVYRPEAISKVIVS